MRVIALAVLAASALACAPTPYLDASRAYAKTAAEGATKLGEARGTLVEACHRRAQYGYLLGRLERFKAERLGLPAPEPSLLPWSKYYDAVPREGGESPNAHCARVAATASGFSAGVGALAAYAGALGALADAGKSIGASMGSTGDDAAKIAKAITGNDDASGAIRTAANASGALTDLVLNTRKDEDLHQFVASADLHVGRLVDSLLKYLDAESAEIEGSLSMEANAVSALEAFTGIGATPLAPPARTSPGDDAMTQKLAAMDQKLTLGPQSLDGVRLLSFFQLARDTVEEARKTRDTIATYRAVLTGLKSTHHALVNAGAAPEAKTWAQFLSELTDLAQKLGELKGLTAPKR